MATPAAVPARADASRRTGAPVGYDFRRPIQLSREHSRILQLSFDGFARQATQVFTSALRTVCSVSMASIDQLTYSEYVDSLDATTYMTLCTVDPMPGRGVLEVPLPAVMSCVDHMLGGPGSDTQPLRPLTEIETGVISGVIARLFSEMRYSLAGLVPIEPEIVGTEYSPQFAQAAGAADVMVVVSLELRIGQRAHRLTVCLPFSGLHPHLTAAAAPAPVSERERAQRDRAAALLRERFTTVPVDVTVRLRPTPVAPEVLAALVPGGVVRLGHPASAPLDVVVDGTTFAHASAGARGPRLAALIVGEPEETA
ncbi:flagellar motor switch protein FliM [Nocardioides perillae]|nr:flagellar motor switch protein FliM [Nocardioides perillae]